ncbi:MAG: carbohydrate ABC transporter permease [Spirochaetales bacterium]|nr:carbohydrate ABC transporter permease [Spirochaetales bacterium]
MSYLKTKKRKHFIKYSIMTLAAMVFMYPVWLVFINSLKGDTEIYTNLFGLPNQFQFGNYADAWVNGKFGMYYMNSIVITTASVGFILIFSLLTAFALSRQDLIGKKFINTLLVIGITVPVQVSLMPLFVQIRNLGLYNTIFGVVLIFIAFRIAFATFIMTGFIEGIPRELEEAAMIDGATQYSLFTKIILPLSKSSITAVAIFNIVFVWNNFWFPLIFLSSQAKKTLPVGLLAFQGEETMAFGKLFAGIMILTLPVIVVYLLLQKQFVQGVTAGAVKG